MAKKLKLSPRLLIGREVPFINNKELHEKYGFPNFPLHGEKVKVLEFDEWKGTSRVHWPERGWDFNVDIEFLEIPEDCYVKVNPEPEEEDD